MTRLLSELLEAIEPGFRTGLQKLEAASGHPNTDIRLSAEVRQATRSKLRELGLDPSDTTVEELYHALQERVKADDARLTRVLQTQAASHVSAEADVVAGMVHVLGALPDAKRSFALKPSTLKTLIKRQPPKRTMKQLGYRSIDSFLKHESPYLVVAGAKLCESAAWQRQWFTQYKQLAARDFEERQIMLLHPDNARWQRLAREQVATTQHNLLSLRELGALVFLPLPTEAPPGTATASLTLALHQLNGIRAAGTFLKLNQVRADFGQVVQAVASGEPRLQAHQLDQDVPWQLIHRHYAQGLQPAGTALEPHLRLEDMAWHPVEQTLAAIEPSFQFWQDTAHLGLLHQGQVVSLNLLDAAINFCNQLPFEQRIVHYFQRSLGHELLLRYLHRDMVEQTVADELQPEPALVEDAVESSV